MMDPDRQSRLKINLSQHDDLPESERPTFIFRLPSRRDSRNITKLLLRLGKIGEVSEGDDDTSNLERAESLLDEIGNVLQAMLIDWRNLPIPFIREDLDAVITEQDLGELLALVRVTPGLQAFEKKVSHSPSASSITTTETKKSSSLSAPSVVTTDESAVAVEETDDS